VVYVGRRLEAVMRDGPADPDLSSLIAGLGRRIPHSPEAEAICLGSVLYQNRIRERLHFLRSEHFAVQDYGETWRVICEAIDAGAAATPVTLAGACEAMGGARYLMDLADRAVPKGDAVAHGRLVVEHALRRQLIAAAEAAVDRAYGPDILDTVAQQTEAYRADLDRIAAAAAGVCSVLPLMTADDFAVLPPPRGWLMGYEICREFVTLLTAAGGSGKSATAMLWALSLATGQPLAGFYVHCRCRVAVVASEDSRDEIHRRLLAAAILYNVDLRQLVADGWLSVSILTATGTQLLTMIAGEAVDTGLAGSIDTMIRQRRIDCLVVDPWVKVAGVPENDNQLMDRAINKLVSIAARRSAAVVVLHHHRKGQAAAGDRDMSRGAGSLTDAVRISRTLTPMDPDTAEKHGIADKDRPRYACLSDAKLNLAPRGDAIWYEIVGVDLGNSTPAYPKGDNIQTVRRWHPPPAGELDAAHDDMIIEAIDAGTDDGERYTESNRSSAGPRSAINAVLKVCPDKTKAQAREIIARLIRDGRIVSRSYHSTAQRKERMGLFSADGQP